MSVRTHNWRSAWALLPPARLQAWPEVLQQIQHAINTAPNRALGGMSSFEVLHGFRSRTEVDNLAGAPGLDAPFDAAKLRELITAVQSVAALRMAVSAMGDKGRVDATRHQVTFAAGDWVLVWTPARPTKLHSYYKGPYVVVGPDEGAAGYYVVRETLGSESAAGTGPERSVSVRQMLPFSHARTTAKAEAERELPTGYFLVESILAHRAKASHPEEIEFLVRWKGYGPERDQWQPAYGLTRLRVWKDYCAARKLLGRARKQATAEHKRMFREQRAAVERQ
jgi:hypothetical protein